MGDPTPNLACNAVCISPKHRCMYVYEGAGFSRIDSASSTFPTSFLTSALTPSPPSARSARAFATATSPSQSLLNTLYNPLPTIPDAYHNPLPSPTANGAGRHDLGDQVSGGVSLNGLIRSFQLNATGVTAARSEVVGMIYLAQSIGPGLTRDFDSFSSTQRRTRTSFG